MGFIHGGPAGDHRARRAANGRGGHHGSEKNGQISTYNWKTHIRIITVRIWFFTWNTYIYIYILDDNCDGIWIMWPSNPIIFNLWSVGYELTWIIHDMFNTTWIVGIWSIWAGFLDWRSPSHSRLYQKWSNLDALLGRSVTSTIGLFLFSWDEQHQLRIRRYCMVLPLC